jgi:hypothetical protein
MKSDQPMEGVALILSGNPAQLSAVAGKNAWDNHKEANTSWITTAIANI